jgi:hypothetical protein
MTQVDVAVAPVRRRRRYIPRPPKPFDKRTRLGRRRKALVALFSAQVGGDVPPALAVRITAAAELLALSEHYRAQFLNGEAPIPVDDLIRLERLAHATLRALHLDQRGAKQKQPSLSEYLAARNGSTP